MESLELRIFKEVAYTRSITKAAENMGYVQSNITAHIKKLESELNTILLIRTNKGVELTQEGEILLQQAEKIISLIDETARSFKHVTTPLNIGTTQTIAGYLLPQCLAKYHKQFPDISIAVHTLDQNIFDTGLGNGELDCIITNNSKRILQGKQIFQYPEELLLIAPFSCQSLEQIEQYPVIVNNIEACPYRKTLLNWWNLHQIKPPVIIEIDTVEAILNMVENGAGISLLPGISIFNRQKIKTFYIEELQTTSIHMWIGKHNKLSSFNDLINIIKEQLKRVSYENKHCCIRDV